MIKTVMTSTTFAENETCYKILAPSESAYVTTLAYISASDASGKVALLISKYSTSMQIGITSPSAIKLMVYVYVPKDLSHEYGRPARVA